MKRFLLIVLALIGVSLAILFAYDALNLWLIRHSPSDTAYKMERLFSDSGKDDIAIFGSSRASCNYAPSVLVGTNSNLRCFNYGINGGCIRETLFLVKETMKKKKGGTIIVNFDPWGFEDYGDKPTSGFYGDYSLAARDQAVRKELPEGLVRFSDWCPGIRFQGHLKKSLAGYWNARKTVMMVVDHGATLNKQVRSKKEWDAIAVKLVGDKYVGPSPEAEKEMDEIDRLSRQAGAPRVLWVVTPCTPAWDRHFTGRAELAEYVKHINALDNPRNRAIDLYNLEGFTLDDFKDNTHFNLEGARKFSEQLSKLNLFDQGSN